MLRVRPHTSIFQQIILPHLASTGPVRARAQRATTTTTTTTIAVSESARPGPGPRTLRQLRRSFTSSQSRSRPPDAAADVSYHRNATWEPYTPAPSSSRVGTREYLGLGGSERGRTRDGTDPERDMETYRKTTAMALERIIKSHELPSTPQPTTRRDKGKQVQRDVGDDLRSSSQISTQANTDYDSSSVATDAMIPSARTEKSSQTDDLDPDQDPRLPTEDHPFPPLIHRLLLARQFRLTTLHILNSSSYALDHSLVERVAGYMERHHGKNAARRLRKGRIPTVEDRSLMTQGGLDADEPPPSLLGSIPPSSPSSEGMADRFPGIDLNRQERLTAFYNTQIAHQLTTSCLPKGLVPPKSLPRPNTSLRQLRSLLARIHTLESCRGFVPDRVTANLVLGCWVRCALAPNPDGVRMVLAKGRQWKISPRHTSTINRQFGGEELGKLFQLVSRLFDRAAGLSSPADVDVDNVHSDSDVVTAPTGSRKKKSKVIRPDMADTAGVRSGVDPGLNYGRHIKPFVKIFQHGYKQQKNLAGLDALREWDMRIRTVLSERNVKGGSPVMSDTEEEVD